MNSAITSGSMCPSRARVLGEQLGGLPEEWLDAAGIVGRAHHQRGEEVYLGLDLSSVLDLTAGGLRLVPWGQGFRDMGPAIDAVELAIMEHKLVHPNNPVLNWNMA